MIQVKSATGLRLGLKNKWQTNVLLWAVIAATVVVWQLFIPKQTIATESGNIAISWNSLWRGLFPISPWVGVMCSIGGQLNVLPKVIANPLFLISPAVYALMGVGFHFLSKKWGRSAAKDLTLIFIFGFVQGILTTLNAALTNTLAGGGWMIFTKKLSELSAEIVILRSLANALMFMSSYPMTVLLRSVFKTTDPFRPNLLELRNKKR